MSRILPYITTSLGLFVVLQANHWVLHTKTDSWVSLSWGALGVILLSVSVIFRR